MRPSSVLLDLSVSKFFFFFPTTFLPSTKSSRREPRKTQKKPAIKKHFPSWSPVATAVKNACNDWYQNGIRRAYWIEAHGCRWFHGYVVRWVVLILSSNCRQNTSLRNPSCNICCFSPLSSFIDWLPNCSVGPCQRIAPKFAEMDNENPDIEFIKVCMCTLTQTIITLLVSALF